MSAKKEKRKSEPPTLDNPIFISWLMGDADRVSMLRSGLAALKPSTAGIIVLTNGFAEKATRVLQNLELAQYFEAVCDTRGSIVRNPGSPEADVVEIEDGNRYSKEEFMETYVFEGDMASEIYGIEAGVDHIVYIDDDPEEELVGRGDVDIVELPKEGRALRKDDFAQVTTLVGNAAKKKARKSIVCIFDFDCTLSRMHMFKAMHQSDSKWRRGWDTFNDERKKSKENPLSPGAAPSPMSSVGSPCSPSASCHIEEKPPGLEGDIEEKPPGLERKPPG